jgi:hypothetical protein
MILGTDNVCSNFRHLKCVDVFKVYAMIGQKHSGFMGIFQRALCRASSHIWFERAEARDRSSVSNKFFLLFTNTYSFKYFY